MADLEGDSYLGPPGVPGMEGHLLDCKGSTRKLIRAFWQVERDFLGRMAVLALGLKLSGMLKIGWFEALAPLLLFYLLEALRHDP